MSKFKFETAPEIEVREDCRGLLKV